MRWQVKAQMPASIFQWLVQILRYYLGKFHMPLNWGIHSKYVYHTSIPYAPTISYICIAICTLSSLYSRAFWNSSWILLSWSLRCSFSSSFTELLYSWELESISLTRSAAMPEAQTGRIIALKYKLHSTQHCTQTHKVLFCAWVWSLVECWCVAQAMEVVCIHTVVQWLWKLQMRHLKRILFSKIERKQIWPHIHVHVRIHVHRACTAV